MSCASPDVSELPTPERTYDDQVVVLGEFSGRVGDDGQLVIDMTPTQQAIELAQERGVTVAELTELTRQSDGVRGSNTTANTFEMVTCQSTTSPACSNQYGTTLTPGTSTSTTTCGTIPSGRGSTCYAADVEVRGFYGVELSNTYVQFTSVSNNALPYGGATAEVLGTSGTVGTLYRYGTLEPGPVGSTASFDSPYNQASLRRWRFSFPSGQTDYTFTFSGKVLATVATASTGRAPYEVSVRATGDATSTGVAPPASLGSANDTNRTGCLTDNGDYMVFASTDPLSTEHTNSYAQIYRVRRRTGEVTLVSRATGTSGTISSGNNYNPCMSSDGNVVVWQSYQTDLVSGSTATLYARNISGGTTAAIAPFTSGECAPSASSSAWTAPSRPSISAAGRYVAFEAACVSLCGGANTTTGCYAGRTQVYRWDRSSSTLVGVSVRTGVAGTIDSNVRFGGAGVASTAHSSANASISSDGNVVAFQSAAYKVSANGYLVTTDSTSVLDVYVRNIGSNSTVRVSQATASGNASGASGNAVVSSDGNYVAFSTLATNIALSTAITDSNGTYDVLRCATTGTVGTCVYVSVNGTTPGNGASNYPSISSTGGLVAFQSDATNLVTTDTNSRTDVFVRNVSSSTTTMYGYNAVGAQGNGAATRPALSSSGTYLMFQSAATNLQVDGSNSFDGDTNADVFVVRL